MKKQIGLLLLVASLLFLVGWTAQTRPVAYEYRVLVDISLERDGAKINELGSEGWQLVFVTREDRRNSATLYFQRVK